MEFIVMILCFAGLFVVLALFGSIALLVGIRGRFEAGPLRFYLSLSNMVGRVGLVVLGAILWVMAVGPLAYSVVTMAGAGPSTTPEPTTTAESTEPATAPPDEATSAPTLTVEPSSDTPTETEVVTPGAEISAEVIVGRVQMRSGPGYAYDVLGTAELEAEFVLIARTEDSAWLQVKQPLTNTTGWLPAKEVDTSAALEEVPVTTEEIPPTSAPATTPRVTNIEFPDVVGEEEQTGTITFQDAEQDVVTIHFEAVYGRFDAFDVTIQGKITSISFQIFKCGTQLVTLSATIEDAEGHTGPPVYFSFQCRAG